MFGRSLGLLLSARIWWEQAFLNWDAEPRQQLLYVSAGRSSGGLDLWQAGVQADASLRVSAAEGSPPRCGGAWAADRQGRSFGLLRLWDVVLCPPERWDKATEAHEDFMYHLPISAPGSLDVGLVESLILIRRESKWTRRSDLVRYPHPQSHNEMPCPAGLLITLPLKAKSSCQKQRPWVPHNCHWTVISEKN